MAIKKVSTKPCRLNAFAYGTAIVLATFSGGVATFGLMKLVPGAEIVVGAMGLLFEAGKLTSFAMLHRRAVPKMLRLALAGVGLTLMTANVAGVSGFLSNAYEHQQIGAKATGHTVEASAHAEASLLERQLAQADGAVAQARQALVRARDNKGRVNAAQAILTASTAERDRLVTRVSAANATSAQAEGSAIASTSEFAAVQFIASATGASTDTVAHAAILTISAVPDVLAVLLLLAAGYLAPKAPVVRRTVRRRKMMTRPPLRPAPALRVAAGGDSQARPTLTAPSSCRRKRRVSHVSRSPRRRQGAHHRDGGTVRHAGRIAREPRASPGS
jgi:hypothetical protein